MSAFRALLDVLHGRLLLALELGQAPLEHALEAPRLFRPHLESRRVLSARKNAYFNFIV